MAKGGAVTDARIAARLALIASVRAQHATANTAITATQTVMAGVTENVISAQNITDINAALSTAATALAAILTALNTSMPLTAE